jgi:hypothetical protein
MGETPHLSGSLRLTAYRPVDGRGSTRAFLHVPSWQRNAVRRLDAPRAERAPERCGGLMTHAGRSAPGTGSRPPWPGTAYLVEAGGQLIRGFRRGLDYAFVRTPLTRCVGRGACYPAGRASWILVPAQATCRRRVYESLQGRPEVGPLPTPRRYHAASGKRRRQASPM